MSITTSSHIAPPEEAKRETQTTSRTSIQDNDFLFKMKAINVCRREFFQALEERLNVIRV
jgi:hypothetical protein